MLVTENSSSSICSNKQSQLSMQLNAKHGRLEVPFLNAGHLEVSIESLNASFHLNSPRITGVVGLNGQMFHR